MAEVQQENPFEAIGSEVVDALNNFDETRTTLYVSLGDIAASTPDAGTYNETISYGISATAEAFGALTTAIRTSEPDTEIAQQTIASLWKDDDAERVKRFTLLAGGDEHKGCFSTFKSEDLAEMVSELYGMAENGQDLEEDMAMSYRIWLAGDVEKLSHHIQEWREERIRNGELPREVKVVIDLNEAGKHLRDITKIAVGVSLGMIIHKKFSR